MALPPKDFYSHCPRCGHEPLDSTEGNSLLCEACSFRWYYNVAAAADVIIENAKGEILVTRRAREPMKGKLDFPGGFVDVGESGEQAACREVQEEVGLVFAPGQLRYLGAFPNQYPTGGLLYSALDLVFVASTSQTEVVAKDDVSRAEFVDPAQISADDIGFASTQAAFTRYMTQRLASSAES